ncbi:MAG: lipase maturation factor family protein, partial [Verrucomicrobiota bacterium]
AEATRLLAGPPPDSPPRAVRAALYDYQFTSGEERKETGAWWKRERLGLYLPVLERRPSP